MIKVFKSQKKIFWIQLLGVLFPTLHIMYLDYQLESGVFSTGSIMEEYTSLSVLILSTQLYGKIQGEKLSKLVSPQSRKVIIKIWQVLYILFILVTILIYTQL